MRIRATEVTVVGEQSYSGPNWLRKLAYKLGFSPTWKYRTKMIVEIQELSQGDTDPTHGDVFLDELGNTWYSPCVYGSMGDKNRTMVLETVSPKELGWGSCRVTPYGQITRISSTFKEGK